MPCSKSLNVQGLLFSSFPGERPLAIILSYARRQNNNKSLIYTPPAPFPFDYVRTLPSLHLTTLPSYLIKASTPSFNHIVINLRSLKAKSSAIPDDLPVRIYKEFAIGYVDSLIPLSMHLLLCASVLVSGVRGKLNA